MSESPDNGHEVDVNEPNSEPEHASQELTRDDYLMLAATHSDCTALAKALIGLASHKQPEDVPAISSAFSRFCTATSAAPSLRTTRVIRTVVASINRALRESEEFLKAAVNHAASVQKTSDDKQRLRAGPLAALCYTNAQTKDTNTVVSAFTAFVIDPAVSLAVPCVHVQQWAPVISQVQSKDIVSSIQQPLQKALRRRPQSSVDLLHHVISTIRTLDAAGAADLSGLLSEVIRGTEAVCSGSAGVARALVKAAAPGEEANVVSSVLDRLWRVSSGRDGTLSYVYQRGAFVEAVISVADACGSLCLPAKISEAAITQLTAYEKKESGEAVRVRVIRALGQWMRVSGAIPKPTCDSILSARCIDKEPFASNVCRALCDGISGAKEGDAQLNAVQTSLVKVSMTEAGKGPMKAAPVLVEAARGAVFAAQKSGTELKQSFWDAVVGSKSPLYTREYTASLPVEAWRAVADVAVAAAKSRGVNADIAALIVSAMCVPDTDVRRYVQSLVDNEAKNIKELRENVLHAAARRVGILPPLAQPRKPTEQTQKGKKGASNAGGNASSSAQGTSTNAQEGEPGQTAEKCHAGCVVVCAWEGMSAEDYALASVMCQHPRVVDSCAVGTGLWFTVSKRVSGVVERFVSSQAVARAALGERVQALVDLIVSDKVLQSSDAKNGKAGVRICKAIAKVCDSEIDALYVERLLDACAKNLPHAAQALKSLSPYEQSVLTTDEKTLVPIPEAEEEQDKSQQQQGQSQKRQGGNAVRREKKQRGESRMYKVEDELWDKQVRAELAEKSSASTDAARADALAAQLAAQSRVRAVLVRRVQPVHSMCHAFAKIVKCRPRAGTLVLPTALPLFMKELSSWKVERNCAAEVVRALCECVPVSVVPVSLAHVCAQACVSVACGDRNAFPVAAKAVLAMVERPLPLPSSVVTVIVPLIAACVKYMQDAETQRAQAAAVKLLCGHTDARCTYPRKEMAETLLVVVADYPRFTQRATTALVEIAAGMEKKDIEPLVTSLLHTQSVVRSAALSAMLNIPFFNNTDGQNPLVGDEEDDALFKKLTVLISVEQHDEDEAVATLAARVRVYTGLALPHDNYYSCLEPYLCSNDENVRLRAACAIAQETAAAPGTSGATLSSLTTLYSKNPKPPEVALADEAECIRLRLTRAANRSAAVVCIGACAETYGDFKEETARALTFVLGHPLGDEESVKEVAIVSAAQIVAKQGEAHTSELYALLQAQLARAGTKQAGRAAPALKQASVVCLGTLMRFAATDDDVKTKARDTLQKLRAQTVTKWKVLLAAIADGYAATAPLLAQEEQQDECKTLIDIIQWKHKESAGEKEGEKKKTKRESKESSEEEQRGAAYCLAGLIEGLGLSALRRLNVVKSLLSSIEDKSDGCARRGAVVACHVLSIRLGRLFEPYVVQVIPRLLDGYGDRDSGVRIATQAAGREIMGGLSSHGMRLVLPALIRATKDEAWRTKRSSIELLGALTACAPQQLSACLPDVVPSLVAAVADVQPEVQNSAKEAIRSIAAVIRNPEILTILDPLVKALCDPAEHTIAALGLMQTVSFIHRVDAASLSLVMPVLSRALRERTSDAKKSAVHIIGSICTLASVDDVVPYVPRIVPIIESVLSDPSPDVRAETARALGSLTAGLGDKNLPGLLDRLVNTARTGKDPVVRAGAAQGLSEVLSALSPQTLSRAIPALVSGIHDSEPTAREGTLALIRYIASSSTNTNAAGSSSESDINADISAASAALLDHLQDTFTGVFACCADPLDSLRDAAARAAAALTAAYWERETSRVVPILISALTDDNWHTQDSAAACVNDIAQRCLQRNPAVAARDPSRVFIQVLGEEYAKKLLVCVYTLRFDTQPAVQQRAVILWKTLVANPPRLLRETINAFLEFLVPSLASSSPHLQDIASAALGDIVERLSKDVLPTVLPALGEQLDNSDPCVRRGVCLGLASVVKVTDSRSISQFTNMILPAVRTALCDKTESVRIAAARLFVQLCETLESRHVVESTLKPLLAVIHSFHDAKEGKTDSCPDEEEWDNAMRGIVQVVSSRGKIALRTVIPVFARVPLLPSDGTALAAVASADAPYISEHLALIVSRCAESAATHPETRDTATSCLTAIAQALPVAGTATLMKECRRLAFRSTKLRTEEGNKLAAETLSLLTDLVTASAVAAPLMCTHKVRSLVNTFVGLYSSDSTAILSHARDALVATVHAVKKEEYPRLVPVVRRALLAAEEAVTLATGVSEDVMLPGLLQSKGAEPLIPVLVASLMNVAASTDTTSSSSSRRDILYDDDDDDDDDFDGPDDDYDEDDEDIGDRDDYKLNSEALRELAADALGDVVRLTSEEALRPYVVSISGPLIRIVGDRFPSSVKAAILRTLGLLLRRGAARLRPFLPQLQTTFVKALRDTSRPVRTLAVDGLATLVGLGSRIDQLLTELLNGFATAVDMDSRSTIISALAAALSHTLNVPTQPLCLRALNTLTEYFRAGDDTTRNNAATACAHALRFLGPDAAAEFAAEPAILLTAGGRPSNVARRARCTMLATLACASEDVTKALADRAFAVLAEDLAAREDPALRAEATVAFGKVAGVPDLKAPDACYSLLVLALKDCSVDVCICALKAVRHIMKANTTLAAPFAAQFRESIEVRSNAAPQRVKIAIAKTMPYIAYL